ncbi:putative tyrosinase copper-binding domain, di-copper centre-containing domain superfamily [Septoria linicola]|nr:putative tyrosinase copper-binding domain, di-copper centre-containing domain superfamily [Septoria linicola]
MKTKPSRIGLTTPLYDDFAYVHNLGNSEVASFLPWHRYFLSVYEKAVQNCGYTGAVPYWDWTQDTQNVSKSPIWDSKTGLGGNGSPKKTEFVNGYKGRCVADGPFSKLRLKYYGTEVVDHCLLRSFNNGTEQVGDMLAPNYTPAAVQKVQSNANYDHYRQALEAGPHGAIHSAVGGDLGPSTSPNDPVFFLHHAQVDRLWWEWQQQNPKKRNAEYAGIRTQDHFDGTKPPAAGLADVMYMRGLAEDLPVKGYTTTQSKRLCCKY